MEIEVYRCFIGQESSRRFSLYQRIDLVKFKCVGPCSILQDAETSARISRISCQGVTCRIPGSVLYCKHTELCSCHLITCLSLSVLENIQLRRDLISVRHINFILSVIANVLRGNHDGSVPLVLIFRGIVRFSVCIGICDLISCCLAGGIIDDFLHLVLALRQIADGIGILTILTSSELIIGNGTPQSFSSLATFSTDGIDLELDSSLLIIGHFTGIDVANKALLKRQDTIFPPVLDSQNVAIMICPCLNKLAASIRCDHRATCVVNVAILGDNKAILGRIKRVTFRCLCLQQVISLLWLQVPSKLLGTHNEYQTFLAAVLTVGSSNRVIAAIRHLYRCSTDNIAIGIYFISLIKLKFSPA